MGIRSSIRNFFYAATHANQLVTENQRLQHELAESSTTITMQMDELRGTRENLRFMECHEDRLKSALQILAPKDLSLDTLRDLYITVRDTAYDYEKAGQYLLGHQWFARGYVQHAPVWDDIEKEIYRIALNQANILPYEQDFTAQDHLQEQAVKAIGKRLGTEQLPENMPVGRIDYLAPNGGIRESLEYRNAGEFVSDALHSSYYGEPVSITVYSDPKTGAHIDASWRLEMDTPPQGFQVAPCPEPQPDSPEPAPIPEPELEL